MEQCHLDFETQSEVSVRKVGAAAYAAHPSTRIMSLAFRLNHEPILHLPMFFSTSDQNFKTLLDFARDPSIRFVAHNAAFERAIWRYIMMMQLFMPDIPVHRWKCTAAKAASMALPRALEDVCDLLALPVRKDTDGNAIMKKLSLPRRLTKTNRERFWTPDTAPDDFERMYEYNITDVEAETCADDALPDLSDFEQRLWCLDQTINERGIRVDTAAVQTILSFIETDTDAMLDKFNIATGGAVDKASRTKVFLEWVQSQGIMLPNMQAATIEQTLPILPEGAVKDALQLRLSLSKTSNSKYQAMLDRLSPDGRLRDMFLFCGAHTKRWTGRGVQLQNLPRGTVDSDTCLTFIVPGDYNWFAGWYPDTMGAYSSCIRGMFIPDDDKDFIVVDFTAVEAVTLAWLAGQEDKLSIFRDGKDPYLEAASTIFGRTIGKTDKQERSIGKVGELSLGYGGGINAYGTMARGNRVNIRPIYSILWPTASEAERKKARESYKRYIERNKNLPPDQILDIRSGYASDVIKQRFRIKNNRITLWWKHLENAAIQAVLTGQEQHVGNYLDDWDELIERPQVTFGTWDKYLLCRIPSGNCIVYPHPKVSTAATPWGGESFKLSYYGFKDGTKYPLRVGTYSGKLAENITQAVARDLLAGAMLAAEDAGYPIILHVHDELVSEVPKGFGSVEELERIMSCLPEWAAGLPLSAKGWRGTRYKKD